MQVKRGRPFQMPEWKNSGEGARVRVEKTELDEEVMKRLEASTKAIQASKKDRVLVGTLPR